MKDKLLLIITSLFLLVASVSGQESDTGKPGDYYGSMETYAPYKAKISIANLIADRSFAAGIAKADSLSKLYPHDPHIYVAKGFAYYASGDSIKAKEQFVEAIRVFDFLLHRQPAFQNVVNKATMLYFVYGNAHLQRYWDDVSKMEEYADHWWRIPELRRLTGLPLDETVKAFMEQYSIIKE